MTKQVRIYLTDEAHAQIKSRAALEGKTQAAWIETALMSALAKPQAKRSTKASKPIK
jgi:hypothetical protein